VTAGTAYGRIVTGDSIRAALITHISTWAPSYLAEVARQAGLTAPLPQFVGYGIEADGAASPVCVVSAASTVGDPVESGDGMVSAHWAVAVAAVIAGNTRDDATRLASLYGAALRAMLLQHPSVGGLTRGLTWTGESTEEVAVNATVSAMACIEGLLLDIPGAVNRHLGLATPPANPVPPALMGTNQTVRITVGSTK